MASKRAVVLSLARCDIISLPLMAMSQSACLREEASVLVHGTEGTDSTLQVTSLAQIILDPTCRTIKGFQGLVEREWLQARPHILMNRILIVV